MTYSITVTENSYNTTVSENSYVISVTAANNVYALTVNSGGSLGAYINDLLDVNTAGVQDDYVLSYDAATSTWVTAAQTGGSGGTPGGSTTQVQYNNAGAFAGDAGLTYDAATDTLSTGAIILSSATANADMVSIIRPATGALHIQNTGGTPNSVRFVAENSSAAERVAMYIPTSSSSGYEYGDVFFADSAADAAPALMVDYNTQRVGIGNNAPTTPLDVTGTITASALIVDTTTLVVDATNNRVGVGTASPNVPLEVISAASNSTAFRVTASDAIALFNVVETGAGNGQIQVNNTSGTGEWILSAGSASCMNSVHGTVFGGNQAAMSATAILQADSTTKGFLPPRMTTTQKNTISTPSEGLVIFDTDLNALCMYAGSAWVNIYSDDGAGVTTLANIDALDATTEATIEAAIDTLANLTSIQGRTVTLADAGADAVFGWDDSANAYVNLTAGDARTALGLVAGGTGDIWVEKAGDTMTGQLVINGGSTTGTTILDVNITQTATASGSTVGMAADLTIAPTSNSSNDFRSFAMANYLRSPTGVTVSQCEAIKAEGARYREQGALVGTITGIDAGGAFVDSSTTGTPTVTTARGLIAYGYTRPSGTGTLTATTVRGIQAQAYAGAGLTATNAQGVYVATPAASSTVTNVYGVDIDPMNRGSSANIGLRVALSSGATTNAAIQLSDTTGVVGGGILFGADTTVHRSSANVLTLNGDLIVSDEAYGVGWNGSLEVPTKNAIYDKIEAIPALTDGDKGDITVSGSGTVWSLDAATVGLTELSATGTPSASTYLRGDNTWATLAGGGDVTKVGTPVNNQVGVWTGDGTIEGDSALTFDTTTDSLIIAASGNLLFGAVTILDDAAGTMTLSNIDALDATTEATIEAAIDTLANLTSIQGRTVTLADAGADAFLAWDDSASAYQNISQADARTILGLGTAAYVATDLANLNESTIEAAIDTLANLTSIQGRTVTLADAGADAFLAWDDSASAYQNISQADARTILGLGTAAYVATDLADLNEATIEAAIDTLANLTSIQGRTITLADAGADALLGWDDSASAYQNLSAADARTALALGTLATQSGTFSGTSSGTNTGDQTITLTGDVTGSGTGSFAATIANNAVTTAKILDANVTLAKMANIATDSILGRATAATGVPEVLTALPFAYTGDVTRPADSNVTTLATNYKIRTLTAVIDGGGSAITTGAKKAYIQVPYSGTITEWTLLADQTGSIVIDVWKDTYANYPPTVADTITASAKPTITTAIKNTSTTLTGWTTSVTAGDIIEFNVDSVTSITKCHVFLKMTVTA